MSTTIGLVNELEYENASTDLVPGRKETRSRVWLVRWTTRQVIAACLWSALFGLGCGYAWLFLHLGAVTCR